MNDSRWHIRLAKVVALLGFLVLLSSTYYLRGEVVVLNAIRFSADETRAKYELEQLRESYPQRIEQHKIAGQNYELQMDHYREMLELYRTNYEEYAKRLKDKYRPPQLPSLPTKPRPPEVQEELFQTNADFRSRRAQYFSSLRRLNRVAWVAAISLVGGLLYLLLFDEHSPRWHYLAALMLAFVFMIGPSFHSILTTAVGFLAPPGVY